MEARALILLLVLVTSVYEGAHGSFARDIYRRAYKDIFMNIFEMAYTISEPFGLHRKSIYFLSRYMMQYPQAIEACKELGGHLAEMNSALEFTFVSNFMRVNTENWDEVFISGYRTTNSGNFISSLNAKMIKQVIAFNEDRGISRTYTSKSLFEYFHKDRPRSQNHMPTCLSIERRGGRLAMSNGRCADGNYHRYLCEAVL